MEPTAGEEVYESHVVRFNGNPRAVTTACEVVGRLLAPEGFNPLAEENIYNNIGSSNMFCAHRAMPMILRGVQEITDFFFHPCDGAKYHTTARRKYEHH
jgi:hypothetical protein